MRQPGTSWGLVPLNLLLRWIQAENPLARGLSGRLPSLRQDRNRRRMRRLMTSRPRVRLVCAIQRLRPTNTGSSGRERDWQVASSQSRSESFCARSQILWDALNQSTVTHTVRPRYRVYQDEAESCTLESLFDGVPWAVKLEIAVGMSDQ
jgi:hypothetical protein